MFGENSIIGEKVVKLDHSRQFTLPSFTFAEPRDKIVLIMYPSSIRLFAYQEYENILARYVKLKENATNLEDREKFQRQINSLSASIRNLIQVYTNNVISIPANIADKYAIRPFNEIILKGLGNSLSLRKK